MPRYRVSGEVTVTYSFERDVEAADEDEAEAKIEAMDDDALVSYATDNTDGVPDITIFDVESLDEDDEEEDDEEEDDEDDVDEDEDEDDEP